MTRKYSGEYKKYQPYVVEDIRKVVGAVGGSATGGSGMQVHTLSGPYHSGELAQSQASWAATKVELSNHAALPDVHHAKLHAITDAANHSVTGSQYQIVGLTAVNTLGLLTPSASPAANAVIKTDGASGVTLVDLTVTSDLFMSGYLDFGTDVMYEDASYLQVTGAKAVRFGQNIGNAAWTIYNAGGASFGGSVDIVGSGDLYVAGSLGGAGGVLKTAGNRVGIACVPDSQFALDVAGPARAQYFIGPHATQVKDAIMICHYDGALPYATNFTGIGLGHMGQIPVLSGGVVYRPGKFQKALQIAGSNTNYCPNPSAELDASGWTQQYNGGTLTGQSRQAAVNAPFGGYAVVMTASALSNYVFNAPHFHAPASITMTWNAGQSASLSCWVWGDGTWRVAFEDAGQNLITFQDVTLTPTAEWQRVILTATNGSGFNYASVRLSFFPRSAGGTLVVDGVQYEAGSRATPYLDGSMGAGYAWSNPVTPHATSSTRTGASIYYTLPTIHYAAPITIMAWVNVSGTTPVDYQYFWFPNNDWYAAYRNASGAVIVGNVNCGTLPAGWVHLAMVTDGSGTATAYVNGVSINSTSITCDNLTTFYVGTRGGIYFTDGMIDDFAVIGRALPANEIKSIYESNAPIFAETATVSWVATPSGLVWADERGLWMRGKDGSPVLGVYGGEASTYSWAGYTMEPGDLVLGYNAIGSSSIWWDKSSGKFGFYGAGSGTPQVEIATDGSLTAGAGNVALNAAGAYIITGSTPDNFLQAFSFKTAHAGAVVSSFQGYVDGSANDHGGIRVGRLSSGHDADVFVLANSLAGDISTGTFGSVNTSGSNYRSLIVTRADGSTANVQTYIDANVVATIDAKGINGKTIYSSGDSGGVASTVAITNDVQGTGAGTGTIKMNGATSRNSSGWLKIWYGTNAYYVPLFSTVTG